MFWILALIVSFSKPLDWSISSRYLKFLTYSIFSCMCMNRGTVIYLLCHKSQILLICHFLWCRQVSMTTCWSMWTHLIADFTLFAKTARSSAKGRHWYTLFCPKLDLFLFYFMYSERWCPFLDGSSFLIHNLRKFEFSDRKKSETCFTPVWISKGLEISPFKIDLYSISNGVLCQVSWFFIYQILPRSLIVSFCWLSHMLSWNL